MKVTITIDNPSEEQRALFSADNCTALQWHVIDPTPKTPAETAQALQFAIMQAEMADQSSIPIIAAAIDAAREAGRIEGIDECVQNMRDAKRFTYAGILDALKEKKK